MPELILVRGLPGSGKSSFAAKMAKEKGYEHYEADQYFMFDGHYIFDMNNIRQAHSWCQNQTRKALAEGKSVIVANTFSRIWEMESYIKMGYPVTIYKCIATYPNIHDVPEQTIRNMKNRWESVSGEIIIEGN